MRRTAAAAFEAAGLAVDDVDVLEVHDAFTIGEILTLEAIGVAAPGEGAMLAPSGHTRLGGPQPVNPSGGLLSRGHPLGATGLAQTAELVWQLRGDAGGRQVPGARDRAPRDDGRRCGRCRCERVRDRAAPRRPHSRVRHLLDPVPDADE